MPVNFSRRQFLKGTGGFTAGFVATKSFSLISSKPVQAQQVTSLTFDMAKMGSLLGGWDDKKGTAAKYKSADSNYRTYKPTVSLTPESGFFISTKIDHIRGFAATTMHNWKWISINPGRLSA